jgi:predicted transcriptional regulator
MALKRSKKVTVRLTEDEYTALLRLAEQYDRTPSEIARYAIRDYPERGDQ